MAILNKKELTNTEKVQQAIAQVDTSLGMFDKMNTDLDEANSVLEQVITEDTALIAEIQKNIALAQNELKENKALQAKIKPFIKAKGATN